MTRHVLLSCALAGALFAGCTDEVDVADTDTGTGSGAGGPGPASGSPASGPGSGGGGASSGASNGGSGQGGGGNASPECQEASDCQLLNDCCACEAYPADEQVEACLETCEVATCQALGHPGTEPMCVSGRCVVGFDCYSLVNCFMVEPECPPGEVALHTEGCWGGCVPATECQAVTDCSDCDLETQVCVQYVQLATTVRCLPKPSSCSGPADCACAEDAYCGPSDVCTGSDGIISCECTNC